MRGERGRADLQGQGKGKVSLVVVGKDPFGSYRGGVESPLGNAKTRIRSTPKNPQEEKDPLTRGEKGLY